MNDREVRHGLYLVPERMDARASGINKQPENGEGLVEVLLRGPRFPAQTLGERIRRFRLEQGLYQVQLAELARVDEMTIVNWEKGRTVPQGERLARLATALGIEVGALT
jgi:DNA-binding XRE family transcriptional regulator